MQRGMYDKAIAAYTKALRLDPNYVRAYIGRGITWDEMGEYDKAIADYTEAIRLDPNFSAFHFTFFVFNSTQRKLGPASCRRVFAVSLSVSPRLNFRGRVKFDDLGSRHCGWTS
jgi:tetratricopeptide (TPR) repeat protein